MPRSLRQTVGERIQLLRRRQGLTQPELALLAKMGVTTLNRVEKGHSSMSIDKLAALAKELRCTTDYLLGLQEERQEPQEMNDARHHLSRPELVRP